MIPARAWVIVSTDDPEPGNDCELITTQLFSDFEDAKRERDHWRQQRVDCAIRLAVLSRPREE